MGFESIVLTTIRTVRSGSGRRTKEQLAYSVVKNKNAKDTAVFTIGINLAKQARFIMGDRLDILKDRTKNRGKFTRVVIGGRKLSGHSKNSSTMKIGHVVTDDFPKVHRLTILENVVVTENGIEFDWPKQADEEFKL